MMTLRYIPPDLNGFGEEALEKFRPGAKLAMRDITKDLLAAMKAAVGRPGKGRNIASRPGEPPMTETKAYQKAWRRSVSSNKRRVQGDLGNLLWQSVGKMLEYGTKFMQPRRHVVDVLARQIPKIEQRLSRI
jgi:hypothetical protein